MSDMQNAVRSIDDHPNFTQNNLNNQAVDNDLPDCPDYLSPLAKQHWPELLQSLGRHNKAINELDKDAIGVYCAIMARFITLDNKLDKVGMTQVSPKGYEAETATFTAWKSLLKSLLTYAKQLGLTPPARVALRLTDPNQTDLLDL